jgi:hypothetical protein
MIAYKLFIVRKDGTLGSLFINRRARLPIGRWLKADLHPTGGYAVRKGWHVLRNPNAPHLKPMPNRVWYAVEIENFTQFERPANQGGVWYLAERMKILTPF